MSPARRVPVLHYARHLGDDSESVYSYEDFCGSCRQHLPSPYEFPKVPEALDDEDDWYAFDDADRALSYFAFCPWCGVQFEDEWWRDQPIQNDRVIDHYKNPGTHRGDTHKFSGAGPTCMENHWLAVSGGDKVCWCGPEIEPGIMGCVIRHRDVSYDEYLAARREMASNEDEEWDDD